MDKVKQRIAIAKACGWYNIQQNPINLFQLAGTRLEQSVSDLCNPLLGIPDYLNDLNAMYEADKMLDNIQRTKYISQYLWDLVPDKYRFAHYFSATAAQRAEAFLMTLNLWED